MRRGRARTLSPLKETHSNLEQQYKAKPITVKRDEFICENRKEREQSHMNPYPCLALDVEVSLLAI